MKKLSSQEKYYQIKLDKIERRKEFWKWIGYTAIPNTLIVIIIGTFAFAITYVACLALKDYIKDIVKEQIKPLQIQIDNDRMFYGNTYITYTNHFTVLSNLVTREPTWTVTNNIMWFHNSN